MLKFIGQRLLLSLFVLLLATAIIFFGTSLIGDPVGELRSDPNISAESLQKLIDAKHLDRPLAVQYAYWLHDVVTDRFGTDLKFDRPVWPELSRAFATTAQLVVFAELLSVSAAIVIGTLAGRFQYSLFDHGTTIGSFIAYAIPVFWFALILQILSVAFYQATGVQAVYISGLNSVDAGSGWAFVLDRAQHLALPVVAISVTSIAVYARYLRASMLEAIHSDYVRTARAKGLTELRIAVGHALRNAALPLATVVGVNLGTVFGGTILIETIFSIPGMGLYFFNALTARDTYSLMAWLTVTSSLALMFNLVTDLVYGMLDPRIRVR